MRDVNLLRRGPSTSMGERSGRCEICRLARWSFELLRTGTDFEVHFDPTQLLSVVSWRVSAPCRVSIPSVRRPPPVTLDSRASGRLTPIEEVDVASLVTGLSPRAAPPDPAHVKLLAEVIDALPPIVAHHMSRTVIDGDHRLAAHRARGRRVIAVQWFDGSWDEAFSMAVEANVTHGRPLTLAERCAAGITLLAAFPDRSDRSIGHTCGLSHTTIAKLRSRYDVRGDGSEARVGRDGRSRRMPQPRPGATTRRDAPAHPRRTAPLSAPPPAQDSCDPSSEKPVDAALLGTPEISAFASWLSATRVSDVDWQTVTTLVPLGGWCETAVLLAGVVNGGHQRASGGCGAMGLRGRWRPERSGARGGEDANGASNRRTGTGSRAVMRSRPPIGPQPSGVRARRAAPGSARRPTG